MVCRPQSADSHWRGRSDADRGQATARGGPVEVRAEAQRTGRDRADTSTAPEPIRPADPTSRTVVAHLSAGKRGNDKGKQRLTWIAAVGLDRNLSHFAKATAIVLMTFVNKRSGETYVGQSSTE
jgi:hypothetical protein